MSTRGHRWPLSVAMGVCGLLVAGSVFYLGWPLPHKQYCSGDVCQTSAVEIDWELVDWGVPPDKIACGTDTPRVGDLPMEPGDVCVESGGGASQNRTTYEELRAAWVLRRVLTLGGVALILTVTSIVMVLFARRRRRADP